MTDPAPVDIPVDSAPTDAAVEPTPNHEAAKYRARLRQAEADLERLTGQLADAQRGHVEALISAVIPAETFWKIVDPADVLDDSGAVDTDKVSAAIVKARQELGRVKPLRLKGFVSGAQSGVPPKAPSFADAFTPQRY